MDKLLEEMKRYPEEFIKAMLPEQEVAYNKRFINTKCIFCKRHRIIEFDGNKYHVCNDTYSKDWYEGEHVFYSETADMCLQKNGFISK